MRWVYPGSDWGWRQCVKMLEGLDGDKGSVCGNAGGVRW